jgi:hypothetical protein
MAELSPAAKAVMDAYHDAPVTGGPHGGDALGVAAALQAVADQVVPEHVNPVGDAHDDARHDQWMRIRLKLLAIAAELDNTPQPLLETTTWRHQMTDYRAELQRLVQAYDEHGGKWPDAHEQALFQAVEAARATLAQPEPEELPPGYIDAEHTGRDREMLEAFYKACRSEGGTADEVHLRGLKAVLTRCGRPTIQPVPVAERLPGPEGLTDEELKQLAWKVHADAQDDDQCGDVVVRVCRAAIAADRAHYAHPTTH